MKPTSGAFTMPCLSQACLLGYTPSPQQAFQGDAAHQAQRHTWLTPNGSPGTWYTRGDYRSRWTLRPCHRTVFTAHTWIDTMLVRWFPQRAAVGKLLFHHSRAITTEEQAHDHFSDSQCAGEHDRGYLVCGL